MNTPEDQVPGEGEQDDVWEVLGDLDIAISLVRVARNSLHQQEIAGDEIATLDKALEQLVDCHQRFDLLSGHKPSGSQNDE